MKVRRSRMLKKHSRWIVVGLFLTLTYIFIFWQNNSITITHTEISDKEIPEAFNSYKIAQISDLHNKMFGKNQIQLVKKVREVNPDIIVITGDLVDRRKFNLDDAMNFINQAIEIAPIYYVSGNHEAWSGAYSEISRRLLDSGVIILDDRKVQLKMGASEIDLLGLSDPDFLTSSYLEGTEYSSLEGALKEMSLGEAYKILLSHRPELFEIYEQSTIDLSLTGHAHGGQFRLPLIGGIIAPDQGLFPEYTSGTYTKGESTMVVSRGLGNSIIPIRLFNRPEIVVITLYSK